MVDKSLIEVNLREIDKLFNEATSQNTSLYFSKLAVLELGGWLEMEIDSLILRSSGRCIHDGGNYKLVEAKIENTWGCDYEKNFRPLLLLMVGLSRLEILEKDWDGKRHFSELKTVLGRIRKPRNIAAHTFTIGAIPNIDAPSKILQFLDIAFLSLNELERLLKNMGH